VHKGAGYDHNKAGTAARTHTPDQGQHGLSSKTPSFGMAVPPVTTTLASVKGPARIREQNQEEAAGISVSSGSDPTHG
jgi:hypothetical protein